MFHALILFLIINDCNKNEYPIVAYFNLFYSGLPWRAKAPSEGSVGVMQRGNAEL